MTSFGEQLIAARKAKGYTQEQLAEKLSVSRTTISRWESGKMMPDIDTIKLLSKEMDFNFFTVDILAVLRTTMQPRPRLRLFQRPSLHLRRLRAKLFRRSIQAMRVCLTINPLPAYTLHLKTKSCG